ncbi:hypothetical protein [Pedobacter sp. GR22-6]|uniref:hypothetical protein n=1 Tax=Pedobacter sp. GR22-6 TaxID=3127957 RepID=UPI00307CF078
MNTESLNLEVLDNADLMSIDGGKMSPKSALIIGGLFVVSPILGAGALLGYYVNS